MYHSVFAKQLLNSLSGFQLLVLLFVARNCHLPKRDFLNAEIFLTSLKYPFIVLVDETWKGNQKKGKVRTLGSRRSSTAVTCPPKQKKGSASTPTRPPKTTDSCRYSQRRAQPKPSGPPRHTHAYTRECSVKWCLLDCFAITYVHL